LGIRATRGISVWAVTNRERDSVIGYRILRFNLGFGIDRRSNKTDNMTVCVLITTQKKVKGFALKGAWLETIVDV
jgi:hypothetical protein